MKFKQIYILFILIICLYSYSSAQLSSGDIAIVEYNSDGSDNFAFVTLVDIPASEQIQFTDNGWMASSSWRTGEGIITWTSPTGGVSCGTVVHIDDPSGATYSASVGTLSKSGSFDISGSGDQLIAYQGTNTMIAAIQTNGTAWDVDATTSNTSALPSGLTDGTNCTHMTAYSDADNCLYNISSISDTKSNILASINNGSNWACNEATVVNYSGTITNTDCISCAAPTTQASNVSFSSVVQNAMTVSWTNGNGSKRIVIINTVSSFTNPVNGTDPTANPNYSGSGEQVVYNGSGSNVSVSGLSPSTQYCFKVFEANCSGGNIVFLTSAGTDNPDCQTTTAIPVTTVLGQGDLAVLGLCSNINPTAGPHCVPSASAGDDEISFVCFETIKTGTSIEMTDNGWERCFTGKWGTSEGVLQATRTGADIPAGTVITFRFSQAGGGTYTSISPDANWVINEIHTTGTDLIMNSGGDQIFFMQGGTWYFGSGLNVHDATLTNSVILFGFNANNEWIAACPSTQESNPYPGLDCFSMMPGVASDYIKYTGAVDGFSIASQREWIRRINDPANWASYSDCSGYYAAAPDYGGGYSISIGFGGFTDGYWTGTADENWFDCRNWQSMRVPDENINVTIPNVTNDPVIDTALAECNDLKILANGLLTINNTDSKLDIYGDILNSGTFTHTNGLVSLLGTASAITSTSSLSFYNLLINKTVNTDIVTMNIDADITGQLTLTNGIFTTGSFILSVSNNAIASITGHSINSYVIGNLRRSVNSTGSYDFPLGMTGYYEYSNIMLNSSAGISYIDSKFTSPHAGTTPSGIFVSGTPITTLLNSGYWTFTPDALTSVNYNITLTSRGHTNGGTSADQHTVIKRADSASPWVSEGVHDNSTQSGTLNNPITAVRSDLIAFSDFAIARSDQFTLPVELLSFTGIMHNSSVKLYWSTASEYNSDYYLITKSTDGFYFYPVAKIQAAGSSNTLMSYEFTDPDIKGNQVYYQLIQYDFDGSEFKSDVISVNINESVYSSENNSFISNNWLYIYPVYGQSSSFEIYDLLGKKYLSGTLQESDDNNYRIDISSLNRGIYLIRIKNDDINKSVKFMY